MGEVREASRKQKKAEDCGDGRHREGEENEHGTKKAKVRDGGAVGLVRQIRAKCGRAEYSGEQDNE